MIDDDSVLIYAAIMRWEKYDCAQNQELSCSDHRYSFNL